MFNFISKYNNASKARLTHFRYKNFNKFILKFSESLYKSGYIRGYAIYRETLYIFLKNNTFNLHKILPVRKQTNTKSPILGTLFVTDRKGVYYSHLHSKVSNKKIFAYTF